MLKAVEQLGMRWTAALAVAFALAGSAAADCPDPQYGWTRTIGGSGEDHGDAIAVDDNDNVLIAGHFTGTVDFDPGPGVDNRTSQGRTDVFVTKLDADGSQVWTRIVGGPGTDQAYSLALDPGGNVLITGSFQSTVDFDPTGGVDNHTADGAYEDVFVTKLAADGSYAWTRTLGAGGSDRGWGIAADAAGNVLVTGSFRYTVDFDPTAGVDEHISNGGYDIFALKLASDGSYVWAQTIGSPVNDWGFDVATDSSGNVVFTGGFSGPWHDIDFDPGPGEDIRSGGGAFVTKLLADGSYGWTHSFGTYKIAVGWAVEVDSTGSILLAGSFSGTVDFAAPTGGAVRQVVGSSDIYVTKLNADGSFSWVATAGSVNFDAGYDIAVAPGDDVLVTGYFDRTADFDPTAGQDNHSSKGWRDVFVTRLGSDGSYLWTKTVGGTAFDDAGHAVAASPSGHVLYTGRFESADLDFDPNAGTDQHSSNGSLDIFVTKLLCGD